MNLRGYRLKETHALFPTCVMEFDLSDSISDINVLLDIITNSPTSPHELVNNGESSYHIGSNILDDTRIKSLKDTIDLCLNDYCSAVGLGRIAISNSWWNKMNVNGTVETHRHFCSVLSGAFYPSAPLGSGELFFKSPIDGLKMNDPYVKPSEFSTSQVAFIPKNNYLYIFPSWLEHGVKSNQAEGRIVVSFNADRFR